MKLFSKRNLLFGFVTVLVALTASAAIWGVPKFLKNSTSVKGQVNAYLLDDKGSVNGLLLASGDQLHFSPETGAAVAMQIKIGDEVSAVGNAGTQSSYGREVRVEQITANGRTITEIHSGPHPRPEPGGKHGPHDRNQLEDRPGPANVSTPLNTEAAPATSPTDATQSMNTNPKTKPAETLATPTTSLPAATPEVFKASGTIRTHLVNGHGDVDGLILSSGEQVRFSPGVGKLVVAAEANGTAEISLEGNGVRNERGVVIRPTAITIGNQTITLGH